MYIRCVSCHASVWLDTETQVVGHLAASCAECGQHYTVNVKALSGAAGRELHERARAHARRESVDLQAAYSVVLGLISQEAVEEVSQAIGASLRFRAPEPTPEAELPEARIRVETEEVEEELDLEIEIVEDEPAVAPPTVERQGSVTEKTPAPAVAPPTVERQGSVTEKTPAPAVAPPSAERQGSVTEKTPAPAVAPPSAERQGSVTQKTRAPAVAPPTADRQGSVTERTRAPAERQPAPEARGALPKRSPWYDPAFQEAVEAGHLTAIQASQRGSRESFARKLARRHDLTMDTAYAVADNRKALLEAVRERRTRKDPVQVTFEGVEPARAGRGWRFAVAAGVALVSVVGLVAMGLGRQEQVPAGPVARPGDIPSGGLASDPSSPEHLAAARRRSTDVTNDAHGRPVRVVGPDARSVLLAYCSSGAESKLEALEVLPSTPPSSSMKLGLIRDMNQLDMVLSIPIYKDPETRRWYSGDGRLPIVPSEAPEATVEAWLRRS